MKLISTLFLGSSVFFFQACERGFFAKKDQGSQMANADKVSDVIAASHGEGEPSIHQEAGEVKAQGSFNEGQSELTESSAEPRSKQAVQEAAVEPKEQIATELPKTVRSNRKEEKAKVSDKKPAFLAKDCGLANEGEMGYHPAAKRAFYCNGEKWVNLPKSAFSGSKKKTDFSWDVVNDGSFLCQKSAEGSFRCMKGGSYKQAH